MTAAERLKKRFKGGVPHTADKKESIHSGLYDKTRAKINIKKRKSGRNEIDPGTRKRGYKVSYD